ncbi:MAG TPA: helix-turn-helix domain-containing protein [Sporichthyaceae bacterium]|jgi:excisionase family DNA binding protein|nr:helix-turn-helix domain-containing protein [Sporichthyaceae bacterium]
MTSTGHPVQLQLPTSRRSPTIEPAIYTVEEVAELLGVARSTAYELVRDGKIPARRLGGRWVISRARFHAWLDADTDDASKGEA